MDLKKYSSISLRLGLSIVLFSFSYMQFTNSGSWVGLVPGYMSFISAVYVVYFNASMELILGLLIFFGLYTRVAAGILALQLIPIIFNLGINSPSGIRDIGIFFAALALVLSGSDYLTLSSLLKKDKIYK
ncbi:DoxX family protein [Candidatus Pacearchaeota archaeon]|nr:DoxX family protein [Candidatus Pacearchaeota archaeon]